MLKFNKFFLIYQMGKVGSSSISNSLKIRYGKNNVLHTHSHQQAKEQITQRSQHGDEVVVITGFREPLNRCISAYFQNLTNSSNHWYVGEREDVLHKSMDWLINDYNEKSLPHLRNVIEPWLSRYENTINYKLSDFNKVGDYWKVSLGNIHFYIYKLEAIAAFLQEMADDQFMKDCEFNQSNIGKEKWSEELYKEFRARYEIGKNDYYNTYGHLDYVRSLYSKDEILKSTNSLVINE
jgi:hypothetical protein